MQPPDRGVLLQENVYFGVSFLIKWQVSGLQLYLKNRLQHSCFPLNFAKTFKNTSERLFLNNVSTKTRNTDYFLMEHELSDDEVLKILDRTGEPELA